MPMMSPHGIHGIFTNITKQVHQGERNITVASEAGFSIGSTIVFSGGGHTETKTIIGLGHHARRKEEQSRDGGEQYRDEQSILLNSPLTYSYPPGTTISLVSAPAMNAVGDPHLTNIFGQKFDLAMPGKHVLVRLPKSVQDDPLLMISCEVERMSTSCADMYIQSINITGAWVKGRVMTFNAQQGKIPHGWRQFGKVDLKVVRGTTNSGLRYLNVLTRNLAKVGLPVGGLLGESDHTLESTPAQDCKRSHMVLIELHER